MLFGDYLKASMTNEQAPFQSPPAATSEAIEAPQPKQRSGADPGLELFGAPNDSKWTMFVLFFPC